MTMTWKEKEIKSLQSQVNKLNERIEKLKNLKDEEIDIELDLLTIPDFPFRNSMVWQMLCQRCEIYTVYDLIHASPKNMLRTSGFGKARLKILEDWMSKYNLTFI